jgi:hypothetical protein
MILPSKKPCHDKQDNALKIKVLSILCQNIPKNIISITGDCPGQQNRGLFQPGTLF